MTGITQLLFFSAAYNSVGLSIKCSKKADELPQTPKTTVPTTALPTTTEPEVTTEAEDTQQKKTKSSNKCMFHMVVGDIKI